MSGNPQRHLAIAVFLLVPVLVITAAVASAESQSEAAENGDRQVGAVAEEHSKQSARSARHGSLAQNESKQPPSAAPDRPPTPGDSKAQESPPPAREKPAQDVPAIEGKPGKANEQSDQPPTAAPDRPPTQTDSKTQGSPQQPAQEKPEQEAHPTEGKPENGSPPVKTLKPITPDEAVGILGKKVHGPAGEDMGMVVDVLVDAEGKPRAAVIDFGGFLGVGTRKIATDWQLLQFRPADRTQPVLLSLGQAEVRAAPEYKPSNQPAEIVAPPPPADTPTAPDAEK
jgi:PRC-barrel domain